MDEDRVKIKYFNDLMEEGVKQRELGKTQKSIKLFLDAGPKATSEHTAMILANHLGLAYFYDAVENPSKNNGSLSLALECFRKVEAGTRNTAEYFRTRATALRNLSRPEFSQFGMGQSSQMDYAETAHTYARSIGNSDVIWFTQALVTCLLHGLRIGFIGSTYLNELFRQEVWEYLWVARKEPKMFRRGWLIELATHYFQVYPGLLSLWALKTVNSKAIKWGLQKRYPEMTKQLMSAGEAIS